MYSVAQILHPDFGRSWHEAVAVVQEAASQLVPGVSLPAPDDLLIDASGTLSFGFGSEANENPVAALATLLDELLKGVEAPASLMELAKANTGPNPGVGSVDAFMRSLAFFERPNRANDLRAIASRLDGVQQKPSSTQEFERLRERVMAASETPEPVKTTQEEPKKRQIPQLATRRQGVVAAGIAAGLLLGVLAVRYPVKVPKIPFNFSFSGSAAANSAPPGSPNAPANSTPAASAAASPATAKAKQAGEPLERSRQNAKATTNQPAPVKTSEVSARNEKPAPRSTETASPDSAPATDVPRPGLASRSLSPPTVRTEPVSVPPPVLQVAPAASGLSAGLPKASVAPPANGVYSPETPGVKPPMLVRPQMPREPQPGDDTGYFDMIVDEKGLVEQVKLISPRRRYHDRMLVAAAKAWQFSPATLDGNPVKYRILVPIILSGLPY